MLHDFGVEKNKKIIFIKINQKDFNFYKILIVTYNTSFKTTQFFNQHI